MRIWEKYAKNFSYNYNKKQNNMCVWDILCVLVNTLRPRQDGRHFADDIFKCIFLNEIYCVFIWISLKYILRSPIVIMPALVQIMARCRTGNKPLSEPMMAQFIDTYLHHLASMNSQNQDNLWLIACCLFIAKSLSKQCTFDDSIELGAFSEKNCRLSTMMKITRTLSHRDSQCYLLYFDDGYIEVKAK